MVMGHRTLGFPSVWDQHNVWVRGGGNTARFSVGFGKEVHRFPPRSTPFAFIGGLGVGVIVRGFSH